MAGLRCRKAESGEITRGPMSLTQLLEDLPLPRAHYHTLPETRGCPSNPNSGFRRHALDSRGALPPMCESFLELFGVMDEVA